MATDLETWVTVEVSLASRMDVHHRDAAALRRQRERAGQQEGYRWRENRWLFISVTLLRLQSIT